MVFILFGVYLSVFRSTAFHSGLWIRLRFSSSPPRVIHCPSLSVGEHGVQIYVWSRLLFCLSFCPESELVCVWDTTHDVTTCLVLLNDVSGVFPQVISRSFSSGYFEIISSGYFDIISLYYFEIISYDYLEIISSGYFEIWPLHLIAARNRSLYHINNYMHYTN